MDIAILAFLKNKENFQTRFSSLLPYEIWDLI